MVNYCTTWRATWGAVLIICTISLPSPCLAQTTPTISAPAPQKLGKWRRAETEHFIFYSDGSESDLRANAIKLERFDLLMRGVTGADSQETPIKLTVYFVRSPYAVQSLYSAKNINVSGFYFASIGGAYAVVPRHMDGYDQGDNEYANIEDVVLFHEYAHHLMLQYFQVAYPAWYVEGFAEYISNTRIDSAGNAKYALPNASRAYSLFNSSDMPIEKLLSSRGADLKGDQIYSFYARAWLLTHYLHNAPTRDGQLIAYLALVRQGTPSLAAAKSTFGDLKKLSAALETYLNGGMIYQKTLKPLPEPKPFAVNQLSEASSSIVLLRLKLTSGTNAKEREPIAAELRLLAAKYADNADVLTCLAEAELDLTNYTASSAAADAAIQLDPQNSRALIWKALSLARPLRLAKDFDAAKWKEVRSWILKANRANPDDPRPLFEYYLSQISTGKPPSDNAIMGLAQAVALVPQEQSMRITYASALANQKKYDAAIAAIAVVANNPHGGGASDYARQMIAKITAAKAANTIPDFDEKKSDKLPN
ncbi:MAG: hypothetical protein RLY97_1592 [Pseudomonadota bacterium]